MTAGCNGILLVAASLAAEPSAAPPANLRCEYRANPLGIDVAAPRLSWQVQDSRRGAVQTAYQVVVSTDESFGGQAVVWDSGEVKSDQSIHVVYAGKPLASRQRYFWKVRTWDAAGKPTEYSAPAWWEMGLLSPGDWKALWITTPPPAPNPFDADLDGAKWIWNAKAKGDKKNAYFRKPLALNESDKIERAEIAVTCDNAFTLFVNGTEIGSGDNLNDVQRFDVAQRLKAGNNTLAVKCYNEGGPAGLLLSARVVLAGGKIVDLKTDDQWKSSPAETTGWNQPDGDESGWQSPKIMGSYGDAPWGKVGVRTLPRRSTCMRRDFTVKAQPVRARAYVTGLGAYKLQINGQPVGSDVLAPGWTDYNCRVQYQTHDVTALLKSGPNAIGALLGSGWWAGFRWSATDESASTNLRFLMQLVIDYADGTQDVVVTDKDWLAHASPVLSDAIYHGEAYDARLEMPGWSSAGFDAKDWSGTELVPDSHTKAQLVADRCETIHVTQELPAVWLSEPTPGVFIFDFGQNAAGFPRLKVKGPAGTKVTMRFGEELDPNGNLYRDNYRSARATDTYICKGGDAEEAWEPAFTYRGARYCEVTGYPGRPAKDALTFRVCHTAAPAAGVFESSNATLNQMFRAIMWGQRSNIESIPTDCPQRDERLGWTGDANIFSATSCWNMQMAGFYTKWMRDLMDSQSPEGWVTDVAPAMANRGPAAPGWGDACVTVPYVLYQFYGDKRIIEENYDGMVGWIEYMQAHRDAKSGLYEREGYGDWVAMADTPTKPIGAAYHYRSTRLVAEMAAAIGRKEDAEKFNKRADELATLFNKAFLDPQTNQYLSGTQTANLLPLDFGIVPADRRAAVLRNVVNDIKQRDYHLSTGFLGTEPLMPTLSDNGQHEVAYKLAVQTSCPSWAYMFSKGATTIWERWDTDKRDPGMNSRNHYAFGAVGKWLFQSVAGINIDPSQPGFKHVLVHPQPAGDLQWALAGYASMYGDIRSEWHRTPDGLTLDVRIPANTTASVVLPTLGLDKVVISEGSTQLFAKGKPAGQCPGVKHAANVDGGIAFNVGAGSYHFIVKGE
jgi:alpha-L-rhamnosidase